MMVDSKNNATAKIHLEETETKTQIVRKLPKILNDYVSQADWVTFCDQLDFALGPTFNFKRQRKNLNILLVTNFVSLLINFFITQLLHRTNSSSSVPELEVDGNNTSTSSDNHGVEDNHGAFSFFQAFDKSSNSSMSDVIMLYHFIITCCLFVAITLTMIVWKYTMASGIKREMRLICGEFLLNKPSLSYTLQSRRQHGFELLPVFIQLTILDGSLIVPLDKHETFHDEENPEAPQTDNSSELDEDSAESEERETNKQGKLSDNSEDALEDIDLNSGHIRRQFAELKKKKRSSTKKIKIGGFSSSSKRSSGDRISKNMTILDDSQDSQKKKKSGKAKKKYSKVKQQTTTAAAVTTTTTTTSSAAKKSTSPKSRKSLDSAPLSPTKKSGSRRSSTSRPSYR